MLPDIILLSRLRNTGMKGCNLPVQLYNLNRLACDPTSATATALLLTKRRLHRRSLLGPHWKLSRLATQTGASARCSQCHSATPEYHPSPSPPTTRYLEIILFTDSLTLELAAAQLCNTRHGPSPSAHLHSQLASTPGSTISPSDHLRITANPCLPRSATQQHNGQDLHSSVRRRQYARATPTALLSAAQSAVYLISLSATRGAPLGFNFNKLFFFGSTGPTPDEQQHDPLTSASRL